MPNLYQNPAYDPKNRMNPSQLQNHFDAFYEDIWCELCKYGELEELVVCDNNNDRACHPLHHLFKANVLTLSSNRPHRQRLRAIQVRGICPEGLRRTQQPLVRCAPHLLRA